MTQKKRDLEDRLDELDEIIDSGVARVRDSDGKQTEFRSDEDLVKARMRLEGRIKKRVRQRASSIIVSRGI